MIDNEMMMSLTCPICRQYSKEPNECTNCHQTFCKTCKPAVCLHCNKGRDFRYSLVAKKIIADLDIFCPYCGTSVKYGNLEDVHYKTCTQLTYKCKYAICNFNNTRELFLEHLINSHFTEIMEDYTTVSDEEITKLPHVLSTADYLSRYQNNSNEYKQSSFNNGKVNHSMLIPQSINQPNKLNLFWNNGSKSFKKSGKGKYLLSSSFPFSDGSVSVMFEPVKDFNFVMIGVTSKQYFGQQMYLGGESGIGDWGVAGNGNIGVDGKWLRDFASVLKFTNEKITISFQNGKLTISIGGKSNNYSLILQSKSVYLTVGLYNDGDTCTIVN